MRTCKRLYFPFSMLVICMFLSHAAAFSQREQTQPVPYSINLLSPSQPPIWEHLAKDIRANLGFVRKLYAAPDGLLWLGSDTKGLVHFDGKEFTNVPVEGEQLFTGDNEVFIPGDSVLYLNVGNKVNVFDPLLQKITGSIALPEEADSTDRISKLSYFNYQGEKLLWAVIEHIDGIIPNAQSTSHLLLSKNGRDFRFVTDDPILVNFGGIAIAAYKDDVLVKENGRFLEIDQNGSTVRTLPLPDTLILKYLLQKRLVYDGQDGLWLTAPSKTGWLIELTKVKILPDTFYIDFQKRFSNKYNDEHRLSLSDSLILVNDYNRVSAYHIDTHQELFVKSGLSQRSNYCIRDALGTFWYGSGHGDGMAKIKLPPPVFTRYNTIHNRAIAEDENGNIFVTSYDGKMCKINPDSGESECIAIPWRGSYSIFHHQGYLYFNQTWMAVENEMVPENPPFSFETLSVGEVVNMLDRKKRIWAAQCNKDLIRITDLQYDTVFKETYIPFLTGSSIFINYMYQRPSDGTVWLATQGGGLFVLSEDGDLLEHYSTDPGSRMILKDNLVTCFFEDTRQQLWIGHGSGLSLLNSTEGKLEHFEIVSDEETSNLVYGILPEENANGETAFLWVSTSKGIHRFDLKTGETMGFWLNENLMSTEFNRTSFYKARDGRMYFGSSDNGLFAFHPGEVVAYYEKIKGRQLPIIISSFSKFDGSTSQEIKPLDNPQLLREITLAHGDRYFDIEFTVADFRLPDKVRYTYQLEGYDETWKKLSVDNNKVHYENLPPGSYTLKLRGGLFADTLPTNERIIALTVLPAWYATWWARGLFAMLFFGLVFFLYRFNLNRQLEKAEARRLSELDSLKTRLYTNITHEFRTPLTVIMGVNENIQGAENERRLIRRNSKNLLRLVNQLLDLSKLDSGSMKMDMVQGDVINYLRYLTESFHSMAMEKNISLHFQAREPALVMDFDEVKLQHILYNLLSNAIKFTQKGGEIIVQANKVQRNGQPHFYLKVQDNGIGIPEEQLPYIFDRFFQADSSSTRKGEGTGIGLALTKELVSMMGGNINVQSEVEKGTAFILILPVKREAKTPFPETDYQTSQRLAKELVPDPAPVGIEEEGPDEWIPEDEKPLLLIVEDNLDVVNYLVSILHNDYQIKTAEDGITGIEKALEFIPDIIISDVMMPRKDGFEVCRALKQDERTSHIPIILLTAKADDEAKIKGLKTGADAYLRKPFDREELFIRLEKLVELRRALQQKYSGDVSAVGASIAISTEPSLDDIFMQKIHQAIAEKMDDSEFGIDDLCQVVNLSSTQVYRKMKALTGQSPVRFIQKMRLKKAKELLQTTELNVSEIAYEVGFTDPGYFSRAFNKEFGMSPSLFRK